MIINLATKRKQEVVSVELVEPDGLVTEHDMSMHNAHVFYDQTIPRFWKVRFELEGDEVIIMLTTNQLEKLIETNVLKACRYFCGPVD